MQTSTLPIEFETGSIKDALRGNTPYETDEILPPIQRTSGYLMPMDKLSEGDMVAFTAQNDTHAGAEEIRPTDAIYIGEITYLYDGEPNRNNVGIIILDVGEGEILINSGGEATYNKNGFDEPSDEGRLHTIYQKRTEIGYFGDYKQIKWAVPEDREITDDDREAAHPY